MLWLVTVRTEDGKTTKFEIESEPRELLDEIANKLLNCTEQRNFHELTIPRNIDIEDYDVLSDPYTYALSNDFPAIEHISVELLDGNNTLFNDVIDAMHFVLVKIEKEIKDENEKQERAEYERLKRKYG